MIEMGLIQKIQAAKSRILRVYDHIGSYGVELPEIGSRNLQNLLTTTDALVEKFDTGKSIWFTSMANSGQEPAEAIVYYSNGTTGQIVLDGTVEGLTSVIGIQPTKGKLFITYNDNDIVLNRKYPTLITENNTTVYYQNENIYSLTLNTTIDMLRNGATFMVYLTYVDEHIEQLNLGSSTSNTTFNHEYDRISRVEIIASTTRNIKVQEVYVDNVKVTLTANVPYVINLTQDTNILVKKFQFG